MWKEYLLEIENVKKEFDGKMQPPASVKDIEELNDTARIMLKVTVPEAYLDFLRIRNGLDFDGLVIYGAKTMPITGYKDRFLEGLVEANEIWYEVEDQKQYLFFGDSDISWYCLSIATGKYVVLDKPSGTVMEVYDSFDSMIETVLKERVS